MKYSVEKNKKFDNLDNVVLKDFNNTVHWFLKPDINLVIKPNYFRNEFKINYNKHLHTTLKNDKIVSVIFKVKYVDGNFRTLGSQFGFKFNYDSLFKWNFVKSPYFKLLYNYYYNIYRINPISCDYLFSSFDYTFKHQSSPLNLDQLFTRFVGILFDLLEEYYDEEMEYFSISFTPIYGYVNHKTHIKNVNSIPFKKNISNIKSIRKAFNSSILPLTLDENLYGKRSYSTRTYIDETNKLKRVVTDLESNKTEKKVFDLTSNKLIESFIDIKLDNNTFTRYNTKTKTSLTIKDNNVISSTIDIKLPLINNKESSNKENTFNKHIGTLDIETYFNNTTGKNEVYAIGFCYGGNNVMISTPNVTTYYLDKDKTSESIVLACINQMLSTKYKRCIFYTHNLGGYDSVFILKILADYNQKIGKKYYKMKAVLRENRILKLEITAKISSCVTNTIFLVDSLALLPMSLSSLAKAFTTKYEKPSFPYTFVTEKTLYYVGNTPSIEYYHTVNKNMSLTEYKNLWNTKWDLKQQTLEYLNSDLISLLQIMYEFSQYIFDNHRIQVSECLTITSIAVKIFFNNHYINKLPLIKQQHIYEDLKKAYYGGLSEVYRGYGENLYYYHVNSLYPYASLNDMPGNSCKYIESYAKDGLDISKNNLFGFFYCEVKTNTDYIGLLPYRNNGILTYPVGEFSGWFFSPQIEYALKHGYEINVRKGYDFNRVGDVFKDYILTIYKEKESTTGAKRLINKFWLNGLLGRFGMHIDKIITSLIDDYNIYMDTITKYHVYDEKKISEGLILVTHGNDISKSICEQHGIDYIDVINTKKGNVKNQEQLDSVRNVSVGVSAAVTGYSSIFMLEIKKYILQQGGKLYYTDTDSIVTDIQLPQKYIGTDLGLFKLEHNIIRGYFISSKLYCLVVWNNEANCENLIIKAKGVSGSRLTEKDFIDMLNNEKFSHGIKTSSKKDFKEGTANIEV